MRTVIYGIWLLVPLSFFLMALWSLLEGRQRKSRRSDTGDLFRQGVFLSLAASATILLDLLTLDLLMGFLEGFVPRGLVEFSLFPLVLIVLAQLYGPSKEIRITSASSRRKKR
jgi:hypothetical protein